MHEKKKKGKVLFFVPHSDDLEFGASFAAIHYLRLGYEVIEILMTNSQYGTSRKEFKGNRLASIRKHELEKTLKIYQEYTRNALNVIRLGYVDGFLPFNKKSVKKVADIIRKKNPDIVFAPDPVYPLDFHYDHLNTGKNLFCALKELEKGELPKEVFFYYSFRNNYMIAIMPSDVRLSSLALSQHRSQVIAFNLKIYMFYKRIQIFINLIRCHQSGVRYRRLKIENGEFKSYEPSKSIRSRIKYVFFNKVMHNYKEKTYNPHPEELGLKNPD